MSRKDSVLEAIRKLPENIGFDDAIEEIRILKRIEEGERDAAQGKVRPYEGVCGLIRQWASSPCSSMLPRSRGDQMGLF